MKIKKRPKQNFSINSSAILDSDLRLKEKLLLLRVLQFHKVNCREGYKYILNFQLLKELEVSEPTLIKNRTSLIDKKFITLKKLRNGRSFVYEYRFNWRKLTTLNFIEPIQKINEFARVAESKKKAKKEPINTPLKEPIVEPIKELEELVLKKGQEIGPGVARCLNDETLYFYKEYKVKNYKKVGNGRPRKAYGKELKSLIRVNSRNRDLLELNISQIKSKPSDDTYKRLRNLSIALRIYTFLEIIPKDYYNT